jgi:hypothetical protein
MDNAWKGHGRFRCGAFIATTVVVPTINARERPPNSEIKCSRRAAYLGGYRQLPPNKFAVATCKDPRLSSVQSQVLPWAPGRNAHLKNCQT